MAPSSVHYKRNFLTNVIFRLDFPKILKLDRSDPPAQFQDRIMDYFPYLKEGKSRSVFLEIRDTSPITKQEELVHWAFLNREKNRKVIVDSISFVQEFNKYEHFNDFFEILKTTLGSFLEIYHFPIFNRIGLRYINELKIGSGDPVNWEDLLVPQLYDTTLRILPDRQGLKRSMHSLDVKEGEYDFRFKFGIWNSEYPNPVARKEFILDYDCYYDQEEDIGKVFNMVVEFNSIITRWFENSISGGLRSIMEEITDG